MMTLMKMMMMLIIMQLDTDRRTQFLGTAFPAWSWRWHHDEDDNDDGDGDDDDDDDGDNDDDGGDGDDGEDIWDWDFRYCSATTHIDEFAVKTRKQAQIKTGKESKQSKQRNKLFLE